MNPAAWETTLDPEGAPPVKVQIDDPSKPTAFTMLMGDGRAAPRLLNKMP
jgi:DNA gyrase/topoisomerase IV subunit B